MKRYLRYAHIDRYGGMSDRSIGPFEPGLNVVFGPNEAGKTTVASFVGGVLFGWEEARGVRNTYRPPDGVRSGSLEFGESGAPANVDADRGRVQSLVLTRGRNEDGLEGDLSIVSDVDNSTFKTMFSLTSDELRSLRNASDVTARLLTAGSGTGASPAGAFVEIEQRIAQRTARSSDATRSVAMLADRIEEAQAAVKAAAESVELSKQEGLELRELEVGRAQAYARFEQLDRQVEALSLCRAKLEVVDGQMQERRKEIGSLKSEVYQANRDNSDDSALDERLLALDVAGDRALRDRIEEYADEQAKLLRAIDTAKGESSASSAAYEALLELDDDRASGGKPFFARVWQAFVPALLAAAFVVAGVPTFMHGRSINSLSFTALGIGLVVFALFLAITAIVVMVRPDRSFEDLERRRRDAQWVMLQDKKKLDASLRAKEDFDEGLADFLSDNGLGTADGSLRRARLLLDEAREQRAKLEAARQRRTSFEMRIAAAETDLDLLTEERRTLEFKAGLFEGVSLEEVDGMVKELAEQRSSVSSALEDINRRIGELGERLDHAKRDRSLDRAKLEYEQLRTSYQESRRELAVLLLAKRMLEKSIAAWESKSQPEVYREASRLLSLITDGAWQRVSMTAEGRLLATSQDGQVREVRHLSLGTCQQLYLSLRVAMLLRAETVGRCIPVLADDILVNFDGARRRGAARVLAELARARQVIVFTCHEETVAALREASSDLTYLEL